MNVVKEKLSDAASASQEAASQAAKMTKEYAAAGAQKTQEVYNEYVRSEKLFVDFDALLMIFSRLHLLLLKH